MVVGGPALHPCPFSGSLGLGLLRAGQAAAPSVLLLADTPDNCGAAATVHHPAARVSMAATAAQGLRGGLHPDSRHGG